MKQTKTIPFDWEEYNNNRDKYKVVTRDGDEVTQLTKFERLPLLPVLMGVEGGVTLIRWTESGHFRLNKSYSDFDLQLQYKEEVVESWVNLYRSIEGYIVVSNTYVTKEEAKKQVISNNYIKTINLNDLV
jgi:hypothetical protein